MRWCGSRLESLFTCRRTPRIRSSSFSKTCFASPATSPHLLPPLLPLQHCYNCKSTCRQTDTLNTTLELAIPYQYSNSSQQMLDFGLFAQVTPDRLTVVESGRHIESITRHSNAESKYGTILPLRPDSRPSVARSTEMVHADCTSVYSIWKNEGCVLDKKAWLKA